MSQLPSTPGSGAPRGKAPNDIYTVLVCIGLFAVLGTLGFVIYRCSELLGTPLPGIVS